MDDFILLLSFLSFSGGKGKLPGKTFILGISPSTVKSQYQPSSFPLLPLPFVPHHPPPPAADYTA